LRQNPDATAEEIMVNVDASVRNRHDAIARAIRELELPGCSGSWFAADLMHLRLVDWGLALPFCLVLRERLGNERFVAVLKKSAACRLHDPDFHSSMILWLEVLGEDRFVTFICDSVAVRLNEPAFTASLDRWLDVLGKDRFVTFICNSVAVRLTEPAFTASLNRWLDVLRQCWVKTNSSHSSATVWPCA